MALGRPKNGRQQRPAPREAGPGTDQPDADLDSYLAAIAPEDGPETTGTGRRFGASQVYQLRLPQMANERLKEIAAMQGTSPSALATDWVLQHLEQVDRADAPQPAWPQPERAGRGVPQGDSEITIPQERYR